MSVNDQYALNWSNHTSHIRKAFDTLLSENQFVDVTLSCEGKKVVAHKIILSACSTYFHDLFRDNPCQHPIVILKDVKFQNLIDILKFIYNGEVSVSSDNFDSFLKTAELLQISGLTDDDSKQLDEASTSIENNETPSLESTSISLKSAPQPQPSTSSTSTSITHQVKSPVSKKRPMEVPLSEELITQKKKKESVLDIEIKEEISESNFEEDELNSIIDIKDPLQLEQQQEEPDLSESLPGDNEESEESATSVIPYFLPEKSRLRYELAYKRFEKWCEERQVEHITNEEVLIEYFEHLSIIQKPSTLWSHYSMLRAVISIKKNVDISQNAELITLLKTKSVGYQPNKTKILTKPEVAKFLREADDDRFLMIKVVLIVGLRGACMRDELTNLLMRNVQDEERFFRFVVLNMKQNNSREFFVTSGDIEGLNMVEIVRKYISLRPYHTDHQRFFIGYRNGKCVNQPVGVNTFGNMPRVIATYLKLPNPERYTGNCFRKSSKSFLKNSGASLT